MKFHLKKVCNKTRQKLERNLQRLWTDTMTLDYCQKLASSMPRRLAMVIAADGGSIKY